MRLRSRPLLMVGGLVAFGFTVLSGCAGDDDRLPTLVVEGVDIDYDQDTYEAPVADGLFEIEFRNVGALPHDLVFEEEEGAPVAGQPDDYVLAGETVRYEIDAEPGEYTFYCTVPGHRAAGMVATLTVG